MRKISLFAVARCVDPGWLHESNGPCAMKSQIVRRSVVIAGHRKSISLDESVWKSLKEIAAYRDTTLLSLVTTIDSKPKQGNLSSAIRLFVLNFYREQRDIQNRHKAIEAALHHSSIRELH
jgi:predicted DNA-binding ribbon-helix-helix protein